MIQRRPACVEVQDGTLCLLNMVRPLGRLLNSIDWSRADPRSAFWRLEMGRFRVMLESPLAHLGNDLWPALFMTMKAS